MVKNPSARKYPSSIPGSGRAPGEGIRLPTPIILGFPCGSADKESTMQETWVWSLFWEASKIDLIHMRVFLCFFNVIATNSSVWKSKWLFQSKYLEFFGGQHWIYFDFTCSCLYTEKSTTYPLLFLLSKTKFHIYTYMSYLQIL